MPKKTRESGKNKARVTLAPWLPDSLRNRDDKPSQKRAPVAPKANSSNRKKSNESPQIKRFSAPKSARDSINPKVGAIDPHADREARRYADPIQSREAITELLSQRTELMTTERIAKEFNLKRPEQLDALVKRLSAMVRDGQLLNNRRGGYGVARKLNLISGVILANADGYGFLRPDQGGEDVFLSPAQMKSVLHGDRVLISIVGIDRRGRSEGAIVEVLERRVSRVVGRYQIQQGFGLVTPDDRRICQDVLIADDHRGGAKAGQIVVVEITEPPNRDRPPLGKIVSVLGDRLNASIAVQMAIESHSLPHQWPTALLDDVSRVAPEVLLEQHGDRHNLCDLPLVTIDGEDARDFDDAVFAEPQGSGFRLVVAIADVSHYVQPDTALDHEAYLRATSVYFPDYVVPMLPEVLSNGICSLNPGVNRLCMVCDMLVDHQGEVSKAKFYPAVMRSHARLTYTQVWQALGEKNESAIQSVGGVLPHLENLYRLYHLLAKQRQRRGAIDFEGQEFKFKLAPNGEVLAVGAYERNDAHKLIEECMIAANVQAAKFLQKKKIPAPYRVHAPPPANKYEDLLEFLKEFKLRLPPYGEVSPKDFAQLITQVKLRPDAALLESVLLRSQSLAVYQPENLGHFGLALDAYAHFTSPIRRYPDLLVHRALKHAIQGGKAADYLYREDEMETQAAHCSHCARRADEAERDVDERYKCAWMERHIGSEFDGVVSGVTSFGLFVELVENRVSGLIHVTQLPNDYYHFDAHKKQLTGERRGSVFRLGEPVRILVLRASLEDRKIDFRLVQSKSDVRVLEKPKERIKEKSKKTKRKKHEAR
jgi:ribonuclease R